MRKQFIKASALLIAAVIVVLTGCDTAFASGTLTFPTFLKAIETEAFYGDTNLEDVVLPEKLESIGSLAFADSSVKTINLPASISYIAEDAFRNCDSMKATVLPNSYAYQYCIDHEIDYIFPENPEDFMMQYGGHSYKIVTVSMDWETARTICESLGGHLLTINSSAEQDAITEMLREHGLDGRGYWIGLTDAEEEGNRESWITGEQVSYTNWAAGEPNNGEDGQDYAAIMSGSGEWRNLTNDDLDIAVGYICEWGYQTTYRALLIGEETFLQGTRNEDQTIHWYIEHATRNTGDVTRMGEMLGQVYGNDGTGKFSITSKTDLTYSGIESAIQSTFAGTKDYDVSLFFIATHGNNNGDGELQMPFLGNVENEDETYGYYDDNYLLPFSTLASWLTQYTRGKVIVIIEACGAGSAIYTEETEYEQNSVTMISKGDDSGRTVDLAKAAVQAFSKADPGIQTSVTETHSGIKANSTGDLRIPKYYVLACSRHQELSWGNKRYNYFTNWLIEGIGTADNSPADISPRDQALTLTELFEYVKQYDDTPFYLYENGQLVTYYQHVQRYPVNSQFQLFRFE